MVSSSFWDLMLSPPTARLASGGCQGSHAMLLWSSQTRYDGTMRVRMKPKISWCRTPIVCFQTPQVFVFGKSMFFHEVPNVSCQNPYVLLISSPCFPDAISISLGATSSTLKKTLRQTPPKRQQWPGIQQRSIIALDRAPRWCCWDGKRN